MEIGPAQAVASATRSVATQPSGTTNQDPPENQEQSATTTAINSEQTQAARATQQVQPTSQTEENQAPPSATTPEPDPTSREGVGKFIDTVV